jgi:hypothetical protein
MVHEARVRVEGVIRLLTSKQRNLEEVYEMSTGNDDDDRFSGKKVYGRAGKAVFDIRGKFLHKASSITQAVYEIRGSYIHEARRITQPKFEIRGNKIHEARATQATYEIR